MDAALSNPQYITDDKGRKTAVILSLDAYNELLEDLSDLATVSHQDLPRSSEETHSAQPWRDAIRRK